MAKEKLYAVKMTPSEWGAICLAIMQVAGNGPLHRKICIQLPYLSDEVLESFNQ